MQTTLTPWKPGLGMTAFDDVSNYMGERVNGWFIYSQHRDSDALSRSNYACILRDLKIEAEKAGAPDCVEEHSFGHWAVGHIDQIILTADAPESIVRTAEKLLANLEDYLVYDENHFSELEWNEAADYWDSMSPREKVQWAIDERKRYHWLSNEPVWRFGRMDYSQLASDESTIAQALHDHLRQ